MLRVWCLNFELITSNFQFRKIHRAFYFTSPSLSLLWLTAPVLYLTETCISPQWLAGKQADCLSFVFGLPTKFCFSCFFRHLFVVIAMTVFNESMKGPQSPQWWLFLCVRFFFGISSLYFLWDFRMCIMAQVWWFLLDSIQFSTGSCLMVCYPLSQISLIERKCPTQVISKIVSYFFCCRSEVVGFLWIYFLLYFCIRFMNL